MTDTTVTPEMLLFLDERVNGPHTHELMDPEPYNPHQDDYQFGRLVVWAAMQGMVILKPNMCEMAIQTSHCQWKVGTTYNDDSTPDSIRAAVVVAIARALGWEEGKE